MANILRFVILGDDRGGPAFASFAKQVEKANQAVDRNNAAMKRQSAAAQDARGGIAGLAGEITGFGAAATAASSKSTTFQRVLAGINLATGVLEPAMAGVVVAVGGLAAGFAAAGAGLGVFGAVAKTVFTEASKGATAYAAAQARYASATTSAQRVAALKAEKAAFAGMSPAVKSLALQLGDTQKRWKAFTTAAAPGVVGVISKGLGLLPKILASMKPFLAPVEKALRGIIGQLNTGLSSAGFKSFTGALAKNTGPAITRIAAAIGNVVVGIGGILKAFLPTSQSLLSGIDKITAKFRVWGTTLSGHTGFQSLMATFRTETPLAVQVLKNLGTVILNVGKAMAGLAGVGNSKSLLQLLLPLSGILASLSKNTALDRLALYLYAATTAAGKLKPAILGVGTAIGGVKKGIGAAQATANWIGRLRDGFVSSEAAASAFSGTAGTIGGKLRTVAGAAKSGMGTVVSAIGSAATAVATFVKSERVAAAATWLWNAATRALPWVALAAAVIAVAVLIIKYHRQIWAFVQRVWHDVLAVIMGVWNWVRRNWPLLLGIITGPVGLAVLWIVRNFGTITGAVRTVLAAVRTAWNTVWNTLKAAFRIFVVNGILGPLGLIVHGAAAAFGWVPGLGGKLKTAAKAFDTFKANVNASLGGINGRTVNVGVAMTSKTNPYPGGLSGRKAAGGRITGPGGPRDDRAGLYALSNDEWVIRADSAARYGHAAMAAVNEGRAWIGYAGGGVAVKTSTPGPAAVESSLMASVTKLAAAFARAAAAVGGIGNYKPGAGVQQWRGVVSQALSLAGSPQQLTDAVLYQMQTESGGNPAIVNRTDSNWLAGHPSVGLMQVIRGTFQAYAGRFRGTGPFEYGVSVNPLANIYAAIKYAQAAYGPGLRNVRGGIGSGHGYDQGGILPARSIGINSTFGPEVVLTQRQWTDLHNLLTAYGQDRRREPAWLGRLMKDNGKVLAELARGQRKTAASTAAAKAYAGQQAQNLTGYAGLSGVIGTTAPAAVSGRQILAGLQQKLANLRHFGATIRALAARGLSRALLRQVIEMGPDDGLAYGRAILFTPGVIGKLNATEAGISRAAARTGRTSADALYGTGLSARGGNTYHITVNVPATASKAAVGREIVELIREYERSSGSGWRKR